MAVPFALRRPWLILRDAFLNRDQPDLDRLRAVRDPERFVWAILPHAARTFSSCIALLPARTAKAAAVGYLYCRILDTYEDLAPDLGQRVSLLQAFARRFPPPEPTPAALLPAPGLTPTACLDARDRSHLLLVERCAAVDHLHQRLPAADRVAIRRLVRDMAAGMVHTARLSAHQGNRLLDRPQLERYCHAVLGNPVAFAMRLMLRRDLSAAEVKIAMEVGEFIQLANITRDLEKDLRRGVAWHPVLGDWLGQEPTEHPDAAAAVATARRALFDHAMERAPSYGSLFHALDFRRWSLSRASAILMLKFTERYYRSCARRMGGPLWHGSRSKLWLLLSTFPSFFSQRAATHALNRLLKALPAPPSG